MMKFLKKCFVSLWFHRIQIVALNSPFTQGILAWFQINWIYTLQNRKAYKRCLWKFRRFKTSNCITQTWKIIPWTRRLSKSKFCGWTVWAKSVSSWASYMYSELYSGKEQKLNYSPEVPRFWNSVKKEVFSANVLISSKDLVLQLVN